MAKRVAANHPEPAVSSAATTMTDQGWVVQKPTVPTTIAVSMAATPRRAGRSAGGVRSAAARMSGAVSIGEARRSDPADGVIEDEDDDGADDGDEDAVEIESRHPDGAERGE